MHLKQFLLSIALFVPFLGIASKPDSTFNLSVGSYYTSDLSDAFLGGNAYLTELSISRSWYGFKFGYSAFNHIMDKFQLLPLGTDVFVVDYKEQVYANTFLFMPELIPLDGRWVKIGLSVGLGLGNFKHMQCTSLNYRYSKDTGLEITDYCYTHVEKTFVGYSTGIEVEFKPIKRISIVGKFRLDDFDNWTAAFIGGGIKFRIY